MDLDFLTHYLHQQIPLSQSMGTRVITANVQETVLQFPLDRNLNHQKTGFGGSLHAGATLAAWTRFYVLLHDHFPDHDIIIAQSHMRYLAPVTTDFQGHCKSTHIDPKETSLLLNALKRRKRAPLTIKAEIWSKSTLCALFEGVFMALHPEG